MLKGIQVILVDNASTDRSNYIIEEYAKKYGSLIVSVFSECRGAGSARNSGIDYAIGKYIAFVDADDYVDSMMYEKLFRSAEKYSADIAICDYLLLTKNGIVKEHHYREYNDVKQFNTDDVSLANIHKSDLLWFAWKGIYRKELIDYHQILFRSNLIGEDSIFNMEVFSCCNKFSIVHEHLYIYDITDTNSITRKKFKPYLLSNLLELYDEKLKVYDRFSEKNYHSDLHSYIMSHTLPMLLSNMLANPDEISIYELKKLRNATMINKAYESVSPFIIDSNIKYVAFLLKYKMYHAAKILMDIKRMYA